MTGGKPAPVRLQRHLAQCGVASRRQSEALILAGQVSVNGEVVRELGTKIDPTRDAVAVEGRPVEPPRGHEVWMLHKPPGVVTTMRDPQRRKTVVSLVPAKRRVVPVGRLDIDTTGMLLLTDDGDLAHRLTHPRWGVEKEYLVTVRGEPSAETLHALTAGVDIGERRSARFVALGPAEGFGPAAAGESRWLGTVHEGRKRLVRRLFEAVGHPVTALHRTRVGPVGLGLLQRGKARQLTEEEVAALRRAVGLIDGKAAQI